MVGGGFFVVVEVFKVLVVVFKGFLVAVTRLAVGCLVNQSTVF